MIRAMQHLVALAALVAAMALPALAGDELKPRDLTPVTWLDASSHPPVEIVRDEQPRAVIYLADPKAAEKFDRNKPGAFPSELPRLVQELVEVIRLSTGATLELVDQPPPADRPAIVIGDCEQARKAGIDAATIPVEGFVVKTAPNRIYLVGSTQALPPGSDRWAKWANEGTAWAVADFLERFVGVRWYWPTEVGGRSITRSATLVVPPVHYRDQPVFRQREYHPAFGWRIPTKARSSDKEPLPFTPGVIPDWLEAVNMATYLPYWNYDECPREVDYTDNLVVMSAMTTYPMPLSAQGANFQEAVDRSRAWRSKASLPITTWDYCIVVGYGPYQYPHVVRDFYKAVRDISAGTFINGENMGEWTTTAPTLYVWMKVLWNPDLDVDAALDEMCRRLYGKAGGTAREFMRLQCDIWEKGQWMNQRVKSRGGWPVPQSLFPRVFTPEVVERLKTLRDKALAELADDPVGRQRFLYWTWAFDAFLKEAEALPQKKTP